MERHNAIHQLKKVLDISPPILKILLSTDTVESKRHQIQIYLYEKLSMTRDKDGGIARLEWIVMRDSVNAVLNILSRRNEQLAGHSLLQYINTILFSKKTGDFISPSPGFIEELRHLLKGVMGKSGIYTVATPAFEKYEGQRAARLRSVDLSRMMRNAEKFMDRYDCGLEDEIIERRQGNRTRIMDFFDAVPSDWAKWGWHVRNAIRDEDTLAGLIQLTEDEYQGVRMAREQGVPFGITPYYLSLMDYEWGTGRDAAVRAQVIPSPNYASAVRHMRDISGESMDFMMERDTSPIYGITRRYPGIVILKPVLTCPQICVYCQRNWEIKDVDAADVAIGKDRLDAALQWIEKTPEIGEVLVTGGDPFILPDAQIFYILERLSAMNHVQRIRLGTRTLVTLPQRITDELVQGISRFHVPGKREVLVVTHFEHAYEISPEAMEAVQKFRRQAMDVYNQLVYTFYTSRKFESAFLRNKLRLIGVTPYYTFNTKGKEETRDYRVPIARLLQEQKEESRLMPGTVRTDEIVFNVPRLGKNYLRAWQHHDLISILPDGRRVYEFHPWEKKLELADTYVHVDVSIYDYLRRLTEIGEKRKDYKTIWYYY